MEKHIISLSNKQATSTLGSVLATTCQQSCVIYLYGDLGVGKTTFCRGFLYTLGYIGHVKSPTYTLIESYILLNWTVYHFDLYRLVDAIELELIGIRDYFNKTSLCLIEWPQHGIGLLPTADISLTFHYQTNGRIAEIEAFTTTGVNLLARLSL
ncbi:tRNA (adenosine(37)-N6)-threonylcarbamoyltransferase complex ATPase subunit type 1 TsaE [Candidatus Curculioniphilus buchneri]|uniref:tRNA (adenosine(37)-N6)-threonylcarbamoyltransferase complex ATPase subunit type 1 TsaE n=1 Tax=Candidatus Curculioniphilus buchneri TaxID=690594 RepID=UPI00376EF4FB